MDSIQKILTSKAAFVRISSEDKVSGTNNKFFVNLPSNAGNIDNVKAFIVHSAEVPNVFNNVSSYNNTLQLYGAAATYTTIATIPVGNYTLDELIAQLNIILPPLVAASPFSSTVVVSKVGTYPNEKINFKFSGDDWYIQNESTMLAQIGLSIDDATNSFGKVCFDGINTVMPNIPNLIGETACYIHSKALAINNLTEFNGSFSVVDKIDLDKPYGSICYTNYNEPTTHMIKWFPFEGKKSLRTVDINLRNRTGQLLELPNNFTFSIMIKIYYD